MEEGDAKKFVVGFRVPDICIVYEISETFPENAIMGAVFVAQEFKKGSRTFSFSSAAL